MRWEQAAADPGPCLLGRGVRRFRRSEVRRLCLLLIPLVWATWTRATSPTLSSSSAPVVPPPGRSPSAEARRAAWRGWMRAQEAVSRECEALEAWDPEVSKDVGDAALRRQFLVRDRSDDLGWAQMEAQMAAALARTPEETYDAAVLLARIECDAGDHQAELEQARRLMALAPRRRTSLLVLWRAARCNGLQPLAQRADAALRTLTHAAN